ncbi:lipopolysaccharide kinase InaA family protein [Gramella sp. MAR_2010_147]|uniref:lipopolysaccharide kinase InaA family protein n=1 Tax=Gramella sp. MAR_2010_147 TaxID=1250205 RepID=UPI00087CA9E5|nr:lipopolysaccharide kinase InaA family protein [Gramella sp. MAR_2010_147]SDR66356.1 Lipopolysaccharide kinase (Kdo/WaaP) family protein [Gramella sp. MAR_2010_147]
MQIHFAPKFEPLRSEILDFLESFNSKGETIKDSRNKLKIFELNSELYNVKSFRVPNAVNKIVYRFFRKSKAQRSFEYANILIQKNMGTPEPVAYLEEHRGLSFGSSYYISRHLNYDLTYRELVTEPDYQDHENILRAFTRFTFELHEKQIQFLDHSPGNTLIQKNGQDYQFFLVDLNRMNFKELSFEERMLNFSRLTPKKEMVEVMADEYSKLIVKPKEEVFEKMWHYTNQFQEKFRRKKELKNKLKFWKN